MSCAHCGKPGAVKGCSACKTTRYCDEDCQRAHWALHKGPCKETQRAAARAAAAPPLPPPAGPFVLDLHCGHCGAEVEGDDSTKCGAYNRVAYCRPACQKAHWAVHKEACGAATRARVHAGEGELEGAEGTLKRAMEKAQREQGEESFEALKCMNTYAVFLQRVARFEEAGTLFRKVLEVCRRTLGDSHPSTLSSINNLATLLLNQGKLAEAGPLFRESLDGHRRVLGDAHPDTRDAVQFWALFEKARTAAGKRK